MIYGRPWKTAPSCRTAFLCNITLEFTQSSASRETKSPLLMMTMMMMMSDVAAQPVSGRKRHRLSGSTDPSLTVGLILGPPRTTVRGVLLPPGSRSVLETLPVFAEKNPFAGDERDTWVCVSPVWWGEEGLRLGRSCGSRSTAASSEEDATRRGLTRSDIPSSEGHARLHYSCVLRKS